MDIMEMYDLFDEMESLKRYKKPEHNYFPTAAEINTYVCSGEIPHILPYLLWLETNLTKEGEIQHAEAVKKLRNITKDMDEVE